MEVVLSVTKRMRFIENIPAFVLESPLFKCFFQLSLFLSPFVNKMVPSTIYAQFF